MLRVAVRAGSDLAGSGIEISDLSVSDLAVSDLAVSGISAHSSGAIEGDSTWGSDEAGPAPSPGFELAL